MAFVPNFLSNQFQLVMKNSLIAGLLTLIVLTSCEKIGRDAVFVINGKTEFTADDISFYDTSAHILYLKRNHSEFEDLERGSFAFYDRGEPVFSGEFWPGYLSYSPTGPVIMTFPLRLQKYALKIESWFDFQGSSLNNSKLTALLNRNNLLHSGLAVSSVSASVAGSELIFSFTLTNMDQTDLLILDPEKTGPGLFRYFTNGLHLYYPDSNDELFADNIQHSTPEPWNSWSIDWLTRLGAGESKEFTFEYTPETAVQPGEYRASFGYPGLSSQVGLEELFQDGARVWLGGLGINETVTIQ
jgi:hypothetical protein